YFLRNNRIVDELDRILYFSDWSGFGDDLIDSAKTIGQKGLPHWPRQPLPAFGEFGFFWLNKNEFGICKLQARVFMQRLDVVNSEKTNMGFIEQAAFAIFEILFDKAGQQSRVADMRQRKNDYAAFPQQTFHSLQHGPGVVEMFQHIGGDDDIETFLGRKYFGPRRIVQ